MIGGSGPLSGRGIAPRGAEAGEAAQESEAGADGDQGRQGGDGEREPANGAIDDSEEDVGTSGDGRRRRTVRQRCARLVPARDEAAGEGGEDDSDHGGDDDRRVGSRRDHAGPPQQGVGEDDRSQQREVTQGTDPDRRPVQAPSSRRF